MRRVKDLTGIVFGEWTVIGPFKMARYKCGQIRISWFCRCSCGRKKYVLAKTLASNQSTRCPNCKGRNPTGITARNSIRTKYRGAARNRGLSWKISDLSFDALIKSTCYYCGTPPNQINRTNSGDECIYNGIDRLDNSKGYSPDNVVSCCGPCNHAKGTMPKDAFILWIAKVHENLRTKGILERHLFVAKKVC